MLPQKFSAATTWMTLEDVGPPDEAPEVAELAALHPASAAEKMSPISPALSARTNLERAICSSDHACFNPPDEIAFHYHCQVS
jgi:hypothetical protein